MEFLSQMETDLKIIISVATSLGVIVGILWKPLKKGLLNIMKEATTEANKPLEEKINKLQKYSDLTSESLLYIQQNSLQKSCVDYIKRGSIKTDELKTAVNLYKSYKKFGGDDFITNMMDKVKKLPIKD